ncbi:hypothetical protein CBOM_07469 [Ceraceosorus bombacis]|uniref:Uncharacterized protein n=1 Tax=Ceraceosorus bombacis TaxID=401625 RepID=A0A0P1BEK7_9BASI|nr:hypothetical protein CBOM_07469 [Ceraceosorus bombacis]
MTVKNFDSDQEARTAYTALPNGAEATCSPVDQDCENRQTAWLTKCVVTVSFTLMAPFQAPEETMWVADCVSASHVSEPSLCTASTVLCAGQCGTSAQFWA